jgi:hypothetical protein
MEQAVSLSDNAARLASLLASLSQTGREGDPKLDCATAATKLNLEEDEVSAAADELERAGLVRLNYALGKRTFVAIKPTPALFWSLDPHLKHWDPRQDARDLAKLALDSGRTVVSLQKLDATLGWGARRINPAAAYLVSERHVHPSREITHPYAYSFLQLHAGTRNFAASRVEHPLPPSANAIQSAAYDVALSFGTGTVTHSHLRADAGRRLSRSASETSR